MKMGNLNPQLSDITEKKTEAQLLRTQRLEAHTCWRHCRPQQYGLLAVAQLLQLKFPMPMGRSADA